MNQTWFHRSIEQGFTGQQQLPLVPCARVQLEGCYGHSQLNTLYEQLKGYGQQAIQKDALLEKGAGLPWMIKGWLQELTTHMMEHDLYHAGGGTGEQEEQKALDIPVMVHQVDASCYSLMGSWSGLSKHQEVSLQTVKKDPSHATQIIAHSISQKVAAYRLESKEVLGNTQSLQAVYLTFCILPKKQSLGAQDVLFERWVQQQEGLPSQAYDNVVVPAWVFARAKKEHNVLQTVWDIRPVSTRILMALSQVPGWMENTLAQTSAKHLEVHTPRSMSLQEGGQVAAAQRALPRL